MTELTGTSRNGAIGLGVAALVLLLVLLVQNVLQARAITALETNVAALQTSVLNNRRADGAAAVGAIAAAGTKAKKGKRSGAGRPPQRGDRVARDPLAEGGAAKAGKGGKRRAAPAPATDAADAP